MDLIDQLAYSAAAALESAGRLPADELAAELAIGQAVLDFLSGRATFHILTEREAQAFENSLAPSSGLSGLGSSLKKAVKKVAKKVKDVADNKVVQAVFPAQAFSNVATQWALDNPQAAVAATVAAYSGNVAGAGALVAGSVIPPPGQGAAKMPLDYASLFGADPVTGAVNWKRWAIGGVGLLALMLLLR